MNELIGKYLNGYKIVKIEKDPFIKGQINLWTDEVRTEYFGDRSVTKFYIREESNTAKVYQELVDKEKYELQQRINEAIPLLCDADSWIMKREYAKANLKIHKAKEILKGSDK